MGAGWAAPNGRAGPAAGHNRHARHSVTPSPGSVGALANYGVPLVRHPPNNAKPLELCGRPRRASPAPYRLHRGSRAPHRLVLPALATLSHEYNNRTPVTKHHRSSIRRKQGCCCSRLVALALDEKGLHLLVLQDLHDGFLRSIALHDREERLLRLCHHRAREVVLVD